MDSSAHRLERPGVQGWLHQPDSAPVAALALTHGAGSNCCAPLLVAVAEVFAGLGYCVLRYDLPYRQARSTGQPRVGASERDREGIREAAAALRETAPGVPLYLAGHSYGGRQSTILAAEDASVADGLLLLSYPLHPPRQTVSLRTQHFASLRVPCLFVHGTRDPFGSIDELEAATAQIPARHETKAVQGAVHGLPPTAAASIAEWFHEFARPQA